MLHAGGKIQVIYDRDFIGFLFKGNYYTMTRGRKFNLLSQPYSNEKSEA